MRIDLANQLESSIPALSLQAGSESWEVYVFGVTRIARDRFVQMALVGPRFCTLTVRVRARADRSADAREILDLVRNWLSTDRVGTQAFIESPCCAESSS